MLRNIIKIRSFLSNKRNFSSNKGQLTQENEPVKFSSSPASQRVIRPIIRRNTNDMPWYQPYSVVTSVAIFLFYFCVLREENDIDLEFDKNLFDRIQGLEKHQLIQSYKYNKEHGKSVEEIEKKLAELEAQEQAESM